MFTISASEQASGDGVGTFQADHAVSAASVLEIDEALAINLTDSTVNLGIASTTKVHYLAMINTGLGDITSIKLDSGTIALKLKAGESLVLPGAGIAKAVLDAWSGATTASVLKVSTGAGPATANLKVLALVDP